ncbi:hypothetical protein FAZ69_17210 [Trinickia terrae]|uniref:Uncharacterized protein n=1 Tax=Trinickia terrae TaxID=2571161 RepID=A0A4U1I400_9BURK|nr:hypothetical protein [Trinickia terrae]TKC87993.1 hypothetical protein FAZ69_17210 [Trinickia terrae]
MKAREDISPTRQQPAQADRPGRPPARGLSSAPFMDNRPRAAAQRQLQAAINNSPRVARLREIDELARGAVAPNAPPTQLMMEEHRLEQHIVEPTEAEEEALERKYNFGDRDGKEGLERASLRNRRLYARTLDELAGHESWYDPGPDADGRPAVTSSSRLGEYNQAARQYYIGPREEGHEIWKRVQENLPNLLEKAFKKGYAVNRPDIQALLARAATEQAQLESEATGSAGRSVFQR